MRPDKLLEGMAAARRAAEAGWRTALARAPGWVRSAVALARHRPEAVVAAGLVTGVAVMIAHWM